LRNIPQLAIQIQGKGQAN